MARPVTLSAIKVAALLRVDMGDCIGAGSSGYVNDAAGAELEQMVQSSATKVYDKIIAAWGDDYAWKTADVVTTPAQGWIALPTDFYRLRKAGWVVSSSEIKRLEPFEDDEEWSIPSRSWSASAPPKYKDRIDNLWLVPVPTAAYTIRVHYVPIMPALTDVAPGVPFAGVNGWEDWVICDVARKLRIKEESDTSELERELVMLDAHIQLMAPRRDLGRPHRVQNRRTRKWVGRYM